MMVGAEARAFCIATDATTVPVRAPGECAKWTVFVFIADRDHVVFRLAAHNTSDEIAAQLQGFRGHLLADAAPVYRTLYRSGDLIEHVCWFHCRRYFWRALETERAALMAGNRWRHARGEVDLVRDRSSLEPVVEARRARCSRSGTGPRVGLDT
jgi:hypothetical protein